MSSFAEEQKKLYGIKALHGLKPLEKVRKRRAENKNRDSNENVSENNENVSEEDFENLNITRDLHVLKGGGVHVNNIEHSENVSHREVCKSHMKPEILKAISDGLVLSFEIAESIDSPVNNVQRLLTTYFPRYVKRSGSRRCWVYELTEEGLRFVRWYYGNE